MDFASRRFSCRSSTGGGAGGELCGASAPAIWCPTPWSGRYGQQVIVENPGLDTFFTEAARGPAWIGYHPHGDHVMLGGVAAVDDWNLDPDTAKAEAIRRRCVKVEPHLAAARVLGHRVGLRPGRPSVRLEVEEVDGARVVNDYGHGSVGVMLSWGCARQAVALLIRPRQSG